MTKKQKSAIFVRAAEIKFLSECFGCCTSIGNALTTPPNESFWDHYCEIRNFFAELFAPPAAEQGAYWWASTHEGQLPTVGNTPYDPDAEARILALLLASRIVLE